MALLTSTALADIRGYIKRRIAYAKFKIGSTYYRANIESIKILSNGIVEVAFMIELESGSGTVTEIQLYNTEQQLWLSKSESLNLADVSEGFYYVVRFDVEEVSA